MNSPRTQPTVKASAMRLTGRVVAENQVDGPASAGGATVLKLAALVSIAVVAFVTGWLGRLVSELVATAVGALLVPFVFVWLFLAFFPRLGVGLLILGGMFRPRFPRRGFQRPLPACSHLLVEPGGAGVIRTASAHAAWHEEILLVSGRRVPIGIGVTIWGPRINGLRHAWLVRRAGMPGIVLARGVVAGLVIALFATCADIAMLATQVR